MPLITILEEQVERGQRQLLLRADDYSRRRREAIDRVFSLLRGVGLRRLMPGRARSACD